ncbi:hypothetical protein IC582_005141 [Cucumis melo]|uniref:Uncharacterized protein n=1 Tax=Cucumis melo TaxID=3656 RepID=A0A9I9D1C1_CUCME
MDKRESRIAIEIQTTIAMRAPTTTSRHDNRQTRPKADDDNRLKRGWRLE